MDNVNLILLNELLFLSNSMPFNHMESPYYELMFLVAIFSFITINFHFGGTNILLAVISAHVVGIIKDFKQTIVELDEPTTRSVR